MKNKYRVRRIGETLYVVDCSELPTQEKWLKFVTAWFFAVVSCGVSILLYVIACIVLGNDVTFDWYKFPTVTWDSVKRFDTLEEAIEFVEQHKEFEKEVYYL